MDFLPKEIENFTEAHTLEESEVLKELNRETYAKMLMPRMLSGHLQGQVLRMLSTMIHPKQILEIGTFTGYSAICLAEGLQPGGKIHTIEYNPEYEEIAQRYFNRVHIKDKIHLYIGDAMEVIPDIKEVFDLVFIDADKVNYSNYYDLVFDRVRIGGYIIADNVLWSGKVTGNQEKMDDDTFALVTYCNKVHTDSRVENVLFPIRDGLLIARKIA